MLLDWSALCFLWLRGQANRSANQARWKRLLAAMLFDFTAKERHPFSVMSTQEMLAEEIKRQPEPVLREVLHYLKFLARQREEEAWADVLPTREVEQEVLNILDGK